MDGTRRDDVVPGKHVSIVLKQDQRSGRLTNGIVQDVLTNSQDHHQGIKVRLTSGDVGRVKHIGAQAAVGNVAAGATNDDFDARRPAAPSLGDWFPADSTPTAAARTPPSISPWTCAACTFENTNMELECEMCMTPRG
jgi:uncharacterized repeat protein (TIGR03833 family)